MMTRVTRLRRLIKYKPPPGAGQPAHKIKKEIEVTTCEFETCELCVKCAPDAENVLGMFPFLEGQYLSHSEDDEISDNIWLIVDLASQVDTTAAQELFLRGKTEVLEWTIR